VELATTISVYSAQQYYNTKKELIITKPVLINIAFMIGEYGSDEYARLESHIINAFTEALKKRTDVTDFEITLNTTINSVKKLDPFIIECVDIIRTERMSDYKRDIKGIKYLCENFFRQIVNHIDYPLNDLSKELNAYIEKYPYGYFTGHFTKRIEQIRPKTRQ
jgi:hypothetical protein